MFRLVRPIFATTSLSRAIVRPSRRHLGTLDDILQNPLPGYSRAAQQKTPAPVSANKPTAPLGRPARDEEITSRFVTYVDAEGQVHGKCRLDSVLQQFDRTKYFLVEVDPSARPPVCRLFEKKALFEKQKASKKKKQVAPQNVLKEVTFGWNVSPHDLEHKLAKAIQFLDKGNKVKVDIVHKKGQKFLDPESKQKVVNGIIDQLNAYKMAKKPAFVGHNCIIHFEK
ncbi:hypothetical protein EC973_001715 [Apophysomyces ossiformis]|uniref:Translation initiation factor IF-3 n=1 Tax=Apophysomyces ossiformis TaxID=679940 RepID=A0A8H7ERQ1_9FUNG|nr:hypothetical protein EC973_001715 [Apophysomyces ossiformis]